MASKGKNKKAPNPSTVTGSLLLRGMAQRFLQAGPLRSFSTVSASKAKVSVLYDKERPALDALLGVQAAANDWINKNVSVSVQTFDASAAAAHLAPDDTPKLEEKVGTKHAGNVSIVEIRGCGYSVHDEEPPVVKTTGELKALCILKASRKKDYLEFFYSVGEVAIKDLANNPLAQTSSGAASADAQRQANSKHIKGTKGKKGKKAKQQQQAPREEKPLLDTTVEELMDTLRAAGHEPSTALRDSFVATLSTFQNLSYTRGYTAAQSTAAFVSTYPVDDPTL